MNTKSKLLAIILAAALFMMCMPVFALTSSGDSDVRVYGYRIWDDDTSLSFGWISMLASNPGAVTDEHPEEEAFDDYTDMSAGAYMGGCVYGFAENGGFYKIDTSDWSRELLFNDGSAYNGWSDMTFDYTTGKLYAIAYTLPWESSDDESSIDASYLVTIDLYDYTISEVAQITTSIITLASDRSGQLYGIAMDGCLYAISKTDGACRIIGQTGKVVEFSQSMAYDYNTDTMYWAMCNISQGCLCTVDLETGAAVSLGTIGGNTEVTCLFIIPEDEPIVHAESVSVSPEEMQLDVGLNGRVTATVLPENASEKHVTWTSSAPDIASVDADGIVYALSAGTAVITAETVDGGLTASCTVTVNAAAADSDYRLVDTIADGGEYIILTYINGAPYALVNRNANSNGFAAKLIPVVLTESGEYVLTPEDSSEDISDLVWLAEGDYTEGFTFKSITNELYFAGLSYCNWTAINTTADKWIPLEHTTENGTITILESVRALTVNEDDLKFYMGTTTAYYNSAIFDYVRIDSACEIFFYQHVTTGEPLPGDINGDGTVTIEDALLLLRNNLGLVVLDDAALAAADFNSDGVIDNLDVLLLLRSVLAI